MMKPTLETVLTMMYAVAWYGWSDLDWGLKRTHSKPIRPYSKSINESEPSSL
jgi:hypothetical protein